MSRADLKTGLESSADKLPGMGGMDVESPFGHGRINALKAVSL